MTDEQHLDDQIVGNNQPAPSSVCANCDTVTRERDEFKSGWQRALADYKNLQQETEKRRSELLAWSKEQILSDFIPVYDNFKKAFAHHPELSVDNEGHKQIQSWVDGVGFIMKQFGDVLKNHQITEIKTVGEKFDPRLHETVGEEEVEGNESGMITKELEGGYMMGETVVKVARVIVVK